MAFTARGRLLATSRPMPVGGVTPGALELVRDEVARVAAEAGAALPSSVAAEIAMIHVQGIAGSAQAIIGVLPDGLTLAQGVAFRFTPVIANTGPAPALNGIPLLRSNGSPLAPGDLVPGYEVSGVVSNGSARLFGLRDFGPDELSRVQAVDLSALPVGFHRVLVKSGRKVLLWVDREGGIHGVALSEKLRRDAVRDVTTEVRNARRIPVLMAGRKVLAWWDNSAARLVVAGMDDVASHAAVAEAIASLAHPRMNASAGAPIATDGRTLHRFFAKVGKLKRGVSMETLNIAVIGDSWIGQHRFINALRRQFAAAGMAPMATGFIPAGPSDRPTGVTVSVSANWTLANARQLQATPFGVGVSGYVAYTQTPDEVMTYSGFTGDTLEIHRMQHGGSWGYALNDAAEVVVRDEAGGVFGAVVLNNLPPGPHTLKIRSISGTSCQLGVLAGSSLGVRIDGLGSSGTIAVRTATWIDRVGDQVARLAPDLVVTLFGTNDYASGLTGSDPISHVRYLKQIVDVFRGASPCGVVCAVPALTDRVPVNPLSAYRDAVYRMALDDGGIEFFNFHDTFGPFAQSNSLGLMADSYHPNDNGAEVMARGFNAHLLKIGA